MMARSASAFLLCALSLLPLCTDLSTVGNNGGSSQTVNAKVIIVDTTAEVVIDTAAAARTLHVFSADYMPYEKTGFCDSIDGNGAAPLRWRAPRQGIFSLFVGIKPFGKACYLRDIAFIRGSNDTIHCRLTSCRDVGGFLSPVDSASSRYPSSERYILSVYGSPFTAITDSASGFLMKNIPGGSYTISVRSMSKRIMIKTIDYQIMIDSLFGNKKLTMFLP